MRTPVGLLCLVVVGLGSGQAALADDSKWPDRLSKPPPIPRYDPAIREKFLAEQAAAAAAPPPPAAPERTRPVAPASTADRLALEPMVVHPYGNEPPPPPLPRLGGIKPLREIAGEPFESASARQARIVKMRLGTFGQLFARIPLLGMGTVGKALEEQALFEHAQQLNQLADSIDFAVLAEQDPEITRKARAEYLKLYYHGPAK